MQVPVGQCPRVGSKAELSVWCLGAGAELSREPIAEGQPGHLLQTAINSVLGGVLGDQQRDELAPKDKERLDVASLIWRKAAVFFQVQCWLCAWLCASDCAPFEVPVNLGRLLSQRQAFARLVTTWPVMRL